MAKKKKIIATPTSSKKGVKKGDVRGPYRGAATYKFAPAVVADYPGQDRRQMYYPDEQPDPESFDPDMPMLYDKGGSKKTYPPLKFKSLLYKTRWNELIKNVTSRENFEPAHLHQLHILCDAYVEYEELKSFIRKFGYTYKCDGRQGVQYKNYPQVSELRRVQGTIATYTKMLNLTLKRGEGAPGDEESGWGGNDDDDDSTDDTESFG